MVILMCNVELGSDIFLSVLAIIADMALNAISYISSLSLMSVGRMLKNAHDLVQLVLLPLLKQEDEVLFQQGNAHSNDVHATLFGNFPGQHHC